MKKKNIKKKNLFLKSIGFFIATTLILFLIMYIFLNPMIQDAYVKGYERGQEEDCDFLIKEGVVRTYEEMQEEIKNNINFSLNLT